MGASGLDIAVALPLKHLGASIPVGRDPRLVAAKRI